MTALEKNVIYNAQGDVIKQTSTLSSTPTSTFPNSYTTPSVPTYSTPTSNSFATTYPKSNLSSSQTLESPDEDDGWKGKLGRLCSKIETALKNKFDNTSSKSRSDPLGGYTVKGPGYYEKKNKFTRRVTTRGTPPSTFTPSSPAYISSTSPYYAASISSSTSPSSGPGAYSSNIPYSSYSVPLSAIPNSYTTPGVPVA